MAHGHHHPPLPSRSARGRGHCRLIAVSKRWAMATAAAIACHRSHCFHCHHPRHCHLIAVLKRWAMVTATAMAALRAMTLVDCGGSSSIDDGCRDSGGKDNGNGSNGVGDNRPCSPCHCPLCHPPQRCHHHRLFCCHCHCICQHATKRAMARAA